MPPCRYPSLEACLARGGDRLLAPYAFDEPAVSQLNLGAGEFFELADGRRREGRGQCFYLQQTVVKASAEPPPPPPPALARAEGGGACAVLSPGAPQSEAAAAAAAAARAPVARMRPVAGLGANMAADIERGLNLELLEV